MLYALLTSLLTYQASTATTEKIVADAPIDLDAPLAHLAYMITGHITPTAAMLADLEQIRVAVAARSGALRVLTDSEAGFLTRLNDALTASSPNVLGDIAAEFATISAEHALRAQMTVKLEEIYALAPLGGVN